MGVKPIKRGLKDLIANAENVSGNKTAVEDKVLSVSIDFVEPNPDQPRKTFDEESLIELAESIKEHGVIQPLIVVRQNDGMYMIIAGERRYRASKMAGLTEIPVIVKEYNDDSKRSEISLIENIQREDLNPIEEALAIQELIEKHGLTQEETAAKLAKSRPVIANALRLLKLPEEVIELVRKDKLSAGHARALLALNSRMYQASFAKRIIDEGWSVRETESKVKEINNPRPKRKIDDKTKEKLTADMQAFLDDCQRVFGVKVKFIGSDKSGRIILDYHSAEELDSIYNVVDFYKKEKKL